jgi:predicted nucleic acid-binding protein
MHSFVTETQALVKFMIGKKVVNDRSHQAFQSADRGEATIIIPAIVLMEVL